MSDHIEIPIRGNKGAGKVARVDPADYPLVSPYKWYLGTVGYATTTYHTRGKGRLDQDRNTNHSMHRLIMGSPPKPGMQVDHIDGDRLNNCRSNLRWVTPAENNHNLPSNRSGARSRQNPWGYLGVRQGNGCSTWVVLLNGLSYGHWESPRMAALVADEVVRRTRPLQTGLNFPNERLPEGTPIPNLDVLPRRAEFRSQVPGVSWFKPRRKWRVIVDRKTVGYFGTQAEAEQARRLLDGTADARGPNVRRRTRTGGVQQMAASGEAT